MESKEILVEKSDGVRTIRFNRPNKKNAVSPAMFQFMADLLNKDAEDDDIVITIITGNGDYFTSGFEVGASNLDGDISKRIDDGVCKFKIMVDALINYPKIIIALVNGPAVGVGVTILGLVDVAYASEKATFRTPFTSLGIAPEGCSTYLFPRLFGRSLATEILILGRVINATEALQMGLVSRVIPHVELHKFYESLKVYKSIYPITSKNNKALIMYNLKSMLLKVNENECKALRDSFDSEEFIKSIMGFMSKKQSKL